MWVATADLVEEVEAAALAATSCSLHSPVERCGHKLSSREPSDYESNPVRS
jgi:hypothetical protein